MKLTLLKETTSDWSGNTPNHIYIFSDSIHVVGYIKENENVAIRFEKPLLFSKRYRTFDRIPAKQIKQFDMSAFND